MALTFLNERSTVLYTSVPVEWLVSFRAHVLLCPTVVTIRVQEEAGEAGGRVLVCAVRAVRERTRGPRPPAHPTGDGRISEPSTDTAPWEMEPGLQESLEFSVS